MHAINSAEYVSSVSFYLDRDRILGSGVRPYPILPYCVTYFTPMNPKSFFCVSLFGVSLLLYQIYSLAYSFALIAQS